MFLPTTIFEQAVRFTPLVSIDFILIDSKNQILVGKRRNMPAKEWYYVPSGRIYKNERILTAIRRISEHELGYEIINHKFHGVYEHIYDDNFFNDKEFNTHIITLAITSKVDKRKHHPNLKEQHLDQAWMSQKEILGSPIVHKHIKEYFKPDSSDNESLTFDALSLAFGNSVLPT